MTITGDDDDDGRGNGGDGDDHIMHATTTKQTAEKKMKH